MTACDRCGNLGLLRMTVNGTNQETLGYCRCDFSCMSMQIWKLPKVNAKLVSVFKVEQCPAEWFRPNNSRKSLVRGSVLATIGPKVENWRTRVKAAEQFWIEYGDVFGVDTSEPDGAA